MFTDEQIRARMERQAEEARMSVQAEELRRLSEASRERQERERAEEMARNPMAWRYAMRGFNPVSAKSVDRAKDLKAACDRLRRHMEIVTEGFGGHKDESDLRGAIADLSDAAKSFSAALVNEHKASIQREKEVA